MSKFQYDGICFIMSDKNSFKNRRMNRIRIRVLKITFNIFKEKQLFYLTFQKLSMQIINYQKKNITKKINIWK